MRYGLVGVVLLAACAASPAAREYQFAKAIETANKTTATALDFDLIRPEEGEAIQAITRAATGDLKRAISARRSGASYETWARIMDLVDASLAEVSRLLAEKGAK